MKEDLSVTLNVQYLRRNGPQPASELPSEVTIEDRKAGVCRWTLRGSNGQTAMGGSSTMIYHVDEHDKRLVIKRFLELNPQLVDAKDKAGFHRSVRSHGKSWLEAARAVSDDYFERPDRLQKGGWVEQGEQTCPMCGEVIEGQLPTHLENECTAA